MATRSYKRDSKGRFKGGGGGRVTYGAAGGFANAAHRSKVAGGFRSAQSGARNVSRLSTVRSQSSYRNNVARIQRSQRRNSELERAGLVLAAAGAVTAVGHPLSGGKVVGGAGAVIVGGLIARKGSQNMTHLSSALGKQTRSYNKITKGSKVRIVNGHIRNIK